MRLIGIAGYSGSGKTTLIRRLIPLIKAKGLRVATVKHAHHKFDVDTLGKDSYEHRAAGASQVLVASKHRWALMNEHDENAVEPELPDLLKQLSNVDFVIVEGFKRAAHPKVEVVRKEGTDRLGHDVPNIVAIASDGWQDTSLPSWDLNAPDGWVGELISLAQSPDQVPW